MKVGALVNSKDALSALADKEVGIVLGSFTPLCENTS